MLAWALEADGDLDGELAVRRSLVEDQPTAENQRDYGRALERATSYRAASAQYHAALADGEGADNTLVTSYDRMHFRVTPELSGGGWLRSDPQAWDWRVQAGAALPFGTHHQAGLLVWRDTSTDWSANQVVGPERAARDRLGHRARRLRHVRPPLGGVAAARRRHRFSTTSGENARRGAALRSGRAARLRRPDRARPAGLAGTSQVNLHIDVNEQWNDAPVTIHEGGTQTGAVGHLYLFPRSRVVLVDSGALVRRLSLRPLEEGDPTPTANQLLTWAGVDFNLWTRFDAAVVRGETLDERMVRRIALNDAGVLGLPALRELRQPLARLPHRALPARLDRQRHLHPSQGALGRAHRRRAARRDRLRQHPEPAPGPGRRRGRRRLVLVDAADGQLRLHTPERHDGHARHAPDRMGRLSCGSLASRSVDRGGVARRSCWSAVAVAAPAPPRLGLLRPHPVWLVVMALAARYGARGLVARCRSPGGRWRCWRCPGARRRRAR